MKIKTMLKRYAAETDCKIKDRMMLIIRIKRDGITIRDSAKSLGKSASWGYKWHERYLEVGFDRLADMPRSGRPTMVSKADLKRIRKNACQEDGMDGQGDAGIHPTANRSKIQSHTRTLHTAELGLFPKGSGGKDTQTGPLTMRSGNSKRRCRTL